MISLFKKSLYAALSLAMISLGASQAVAQGTRTDAGLCQQYAGFLRPMVNKAIQMNSRCLDWDRGVHDVYQMHYDWCMNNNRDTVIGAASHVRDLVVQCTGNWFPESPLNVAAPAPAQIHRPAAAKWRFESHVTGSCTAELRDPSKQDYFGNLIRLEASRGGPIYLISDFTGADVYSDVRVGGKSFRQNWEHESDVVKTPVGMDLLSAMKRGNEIDLNFYTHDLRYSLSGSSAAIDQMLQCAGMGAPKPAPKPAAARGPKVIYGSCKLIVDGVQYVNIAQGCPIWMDTDGTFWINTDRANFMGDYIAELRPSGNGWGDGHWNGQAGSTHAQAPLGEDFRMGNGGCWSNRRATICAAR